jgi:hypothetical protein
MAAVLRGVRSGAVLSILTMPEGRGLTVLCTAKRARVFIDEDKAAWVVLNPEHFQLYGHLAA